MGTPALLLIPVRSRRRKRASTGRSIVLFALFCGLAIASSLLSVAEEAQDLTVSVATGALP